MRSGHRRATSGSRAIRSRPLHQRIPPRREILKVDQQSWILTEAENLVIDEPDKNNFPGRPKLEENRNAFPRSFLINEQESFWNMHIDEKL